MSGALQTSSSTKVSLRYLQFFTGRENSASYVFRIRKSSWRREDLIEFTYIMIRRFINLSIKSDSIEFGIRTQILIPNSLDAGIVSADAWTSSALRAESLFVTMRCSIPLAGADLVSGSDCNARARVL